VSLAAALLLVLGGIFAAGQHERLEAAFVAELALDHDRCFSRVGELASDLDATEAER
jgi:hypothetical protein